MDIKSASKAHHMEHKLDDRILTTEYYEPSSVNVVVVGTAGDDETTTTTSGVVSAGVAAKNLMINNNNSSSNHNINGQNVNLSGNTSLPQYSTLTSSSSSSSTSANLNNSSCNNVPGETISSRRFSTSHGLVHYFIHKMFRH